MDALLRPEIVAAALGFLYVVLVVRQSVWCWPAGLVSAGLYVLVFFQARLYGQTALQCVYVVLMAYGWHAWSRGGASGGRLEVSLAPRRWRAGLALGGAAFAARLGALHAQGTDGAVPFWDAGTTSFSLVAQWMTARKWIESWLVWIPVNAVYVGLYASQGLYWTAALYAAFLVLAVLGLLAWRRSLRAPTTAAAPEAA